MITITNIETHGWEAAIRGMRNPMNSWDKSDSQYCADIETCKKCPAYKFNDVGQSVCTQGDTSMLMVGPNDLKLMLSLAWSGSDHAKFRRMINVTMDILAPLYWWKEFDTYKVGTVANSCSTMHKIHAKEFTLEDFSHEHLFDSINGDNTDCFIDGPDVYFDPIDVLNITVMMLNQARDLYLEYQKKSSTGDQFAKDHVKKYWWQMIQLLPSSYNQLRTVQLNYEVLANIYHARENHKLDEWRDLCKIIEKLPYSEIITLKEG